MTAMQMSCLLVDLELFNQQISNGDIVLQEGIFKSSASDADYGEFLKIAQSICGKIKLPTDSKEYEKNKKSLEKAKEKHS